MFTSPMVISKKLAADLRTKIVNLFLEFSKSTEGLEDEEIWDLNVDFIKIQKKPCRFGKLS